MSWRKTITKDPQVAAPQSGWRSTVTRERVATSAPDVSLSESALRGAAQGATLGLADEAMGLGEAGFETLFGDAKLADVVDTYKARRDESRRAFSDAEAANPIAYGAGNVAGGAATMLVPGLNVAKGASLAATAGKAALQGAIGGYGGSESDSVLGDAEAALGGAALGGALGYAGGKAGQYLGANPTKVAGKLEDFAERRAVKSLGPILSSQEALDKRGLTNVLGRELLNEGVVKAGRNAEGMTDDLGNLLMTRGKELGGLRQAADDAGAKVNLMDDALDAVGAAERPGMLAREESTARAFADDMTRVADDGMGVRDAVALRRRVDATVPFEKDAAKLTPNQAAAKQMRDLLKKRADEAIEGTLGADAGKRNEYLNETFSALTRGDDILEKTLSRNAKNQDLGLRDTIMAAKSVPENPNVMDYLKSKAVAWGLGQVRQRTDTTAAAGADWIAKRVRENPEAFGKFAPILTQAAARGGNSLAATHFLMQQQDPHYRETVRISDEEGP